MRKVLLPILAICGALLALFVAFWSQRKEAPPPIPYPPPRSPYEHAIYGEGIVEPSSRNIAIGSPFNQVVTHVFVLEGDSVKVGDPLFKLDTRYFEAQLETAIAQLAVARVNLENQQTQFAFYEQLSDRSAVSEQQYEQARYAFLQAQEDIKVYEGMIDEAKANIEMSMIRSPLNGKILQVNTHIGEVAPNISLTTVQSLIPYGSPQYPLILLGSEGAPNLRIDIDEEDCWRYVKGAKATAFVRGNSRLSFPLKYVLIEPYIVPKASFTGETTERIDTRVLQVLYQFESSNLPIYEGQVLDVYIDAGPVATQLHPASTPSDPCPEPSPSIDPCLCPCLCPKPSPSEDPCLCLCPEQSPCEDPCPCLCPEPSPCEPPCPSSYESPSHLSSQEETSEEEIQGDSYEDCSGQRQGSSLGNGLGQGQDQCP